MVGYMLLNHMRYSILNELQRCLWVFSVILKQSQANCFRLMLNSGHFKQKKTSPGNKIKIIS